MMSRRRPAERVLAGAAVVLLLLLAVEGWAPRLLDQGPAPASPAGRVVPVPGHPGTFEARDPGYRATFDAAGFTYQPAAASEPLALSLSAVVAGTRPLALDPAAWTANGDVLQRPVSPGVAERVSTRDGEVEWDVVLDAPLPAGGDLTVRANVTGVAGAAQRVGDAVRLPLRGGGTVDLGEVVVRDAHGNELHRGLPVVDRGSAELRVPAAALDGAAYPVTVDPTVSGPVTVAPSPVLEGDPNMARQPGDNGVELVVWEQLPPDDDDMDIYGAIVDPVTKQRTVEPFLISGNNDVNDTLPDVAWNGSAFLVVWQHAFSASDDDIYGQLVIPSGQVFGNQILVITPSGRQQEPAVSGSGSGYLVVWHDDLTGNTDIRGRTITSLGVPGANVIQISKDNPLATETDTSPDVVWDGQNWFVVWGTGRVLAGVSSYVIKSSTVSSAGVDDAPNVDVVSSSTVVTRPTVAFGGGQHLVVWEDNSSAASETDIAGKRVNAAGVPDTTTLPICAAAGRQADAQVIYNGGFFVAWHDQRDTPYHEDIYASRVGTDGTVRDPGGFPVVKVDGQIVNESPAPVPGPNGAWDVGYAINRIGPVLWRQVSPK
jgi:hypothetical protein